MYDPVGSKRNGNICFVCHEPGQGIATSYIIGGGIQYQSCINLFNQIEKIRGKTKMYMIAIMRCLVKGFSPEYLFNITVLLFLKYIKSTARNITQTKGNNITFLEP